MKLKAEAMTGQVNSRIHGKMVYRVPNRQRKLLLSYLSCNSVR